ncbi:CHAT domain-containing protein [[Phormidium] sp. ETS-05]|uniref:CHAT domain-containing protein n=1 Tax=[Phormidium] sp. ETS-05 TaxID=222819 RepID=UPI0018EEDA99|nr:CHAT domain-containing protein [[Phormidium] sp. ETS-05]
MSPSQGGNIRLSDIESSGDTHGGSISITSNSGTIDTSRGILGAYSGSGNGGNITLDAKGDINTGFIRAFATGNNSQSGNVTIISRTGAINTTVGDLSGEALIKADAAIADIAGTFLSQFANIDVYAPNGTGGNVTLEAPQGIITSHISSYGGINAGNVTLKVTPTSQAGDINTNVIFSVADGAGDGGKITLAAPNGNISTSHINSYTNGQGAGGAIEITAGGTFNIGAATINSFSQNGTAGNVIIIVDNDLTLGGDANRSAIRSEGPQQGGHISIISHTGEINAAGDFNSFSQNGTAGNVTLDAGAGIDIANIRSEGAQWGGSIEINSDTSLDFTDSTLNSYSEHGEAGDVSITANGNITLGGDASNSAIRSEGAKVGGDISITSNGGEINATAGNLDSYSANGTAGSVNLNATGNIATRDIASYGANVGGNIEISTGGTYSGGTINSYASDANTGKAGDVSITANGNITLGGDGSNSAIRSEGPQQGGSISIISNNGWINATAGNLDSYSTNGTAGNVTLQSSGDITTASIRSDGQQQGGSINITSDTSLDFTGSTLNSYSEHGEAGDVSITANGNITLGGDASNSAIRSEGLQHGGNISITSNGGEINATAGNLDSYSTNGTAGNVTLQSSGDITTASIRSDGQQQGGSIGITSNGGAIDTTRGDLSSYSDSGKAGNVILNAGGGNVTTGNIDSKSPQLGGKITIASAGDLNTSLGDLLSYSTAGIAGDITLKAAGCITTGDIRTDGATQAGSLSITSCNCSIDTSLGTLTTYSPNGTAGDVTLDAVGSVTTGDITSYGNFASGNVNIQSESGTIQTNHIQTISPNGIAGNVTLNTFGYKGDILTANITSQGGQQAGDISVKAPDGSVTTGDIASISESGDAGNINVEAGEDVQTDDITSSGGNNSGDVSVNSDEGSVTTGNITTEAQNGNSGNVTVGATQDVQTGNITSSGGNNSGDVNVNSDQGSVTTGNIATTAQNGNSGNVTVGATQDVQTGNITSSGGNNSGDVNVNSDQGSVTTGNIATTAQNGNSGNVTVGATQDVQTGDITSSAGNNSGNIEVNSSGGSVTTGNVESLAVNGNSGNIALSGFGDVTAGDIRSVAGGNSGDIEVNSLAGNITAGDVESRAAGGIAGNITLDAYQNINTGRITSTGFLGSGDINLTTATGTIITGGVYTDTGRISINAPESEMPMPQPVASGLSLTNTVMAVEVVPNNVSSTVMVEPRLGNNPTAVVGVNNNSGNNNISLSVTANILSITGNNLGISSPNTPGLMLDHPTAVAEKLNNIVQSHAEQLNTIIIADAHQSSSMDDGENISYTSQLDTQKVLANLAVASSGASIVNADSVVASLEQSRSDEYGEYFGSNFGQGLNTTASMREAMSKIAAETGYKSAIIYVMAQPDQLELILFLGSGQLIRKTVPEAPREKLLEVVSQFRSQLTATRLGKRTDGYRKPAEQLYQWLIAPIEGELQAAGINTLLLSMDSGLRSLPMAALYDGHQFLVEKYSMSLIPSMNLIDPRYQQLKDTRVLAMGASTFPDLDPLPAVPVELSAVTEDLWQGEGFLNEEFTRSNLVRQRQQNPYPIIHLATHGEFKPGTPENSYIQLWGDEKLRLNQLRELGWNNPAVELLVLSACRTALGDEQAEMGFAGLAVQAGVKSALASLWSVSDEGTLALMTEFYRNLENSKIKAEALRQAQIAMIRGELEVSAGELRSSGGTRGALALPPELSEVENSNLSHPYYWSAFTMIGSPW